MLCPGKISLVKGMLQAKLLTPDDELVISAETELRPSDVTMNTRENRFQNDQQKKPHSQILSVWVVHTENRPCCISKCFASPITPLFERRA